MTIAAASMTAEELWDLPSDNVRHELIRGELTTMPPTGAEHGTSTFNIATMLGIFLKSHDLGVGVGAETGFIIRRNPDTMFLLRIALSFAQIVSTNRRSQKLLAHRARSGRGGIVPSDRSNEVVEKVDEWLAAGTRLVWLIDPVKKFVTVYAPNRQPQILRGDQRLIGEDILPGFDLPVAEIFR